MFLEDVNFNNEQIFDESVSLDVDDINVFLLLNANELMEVNEGRRKYRSAASDRWFKKRFKKWQLTNTFHAETNQNICLWMSLMALSTHSSFLCKN